MPDRGRSPGFHERRDTRLGASTAGEDVADSEFSYTFQNFFHPYVGELIERLNKGSVAGLLDPVYQEKLNAKGEGFFESFYDPAPTGLVTSFPKDIDVRPGGPYANYNWELLFHVPLSIAVHLSNNQRFAEAQRWFHYIFDPTSTDTSVQGPARYWKFLAFRGDAETQNITQVVNLLSTPDDELSAEQRMTKDTLLEGYGSIRRFPFEPHRVAATRPVAYQYQVVMKYLDNLIAWGDSLFREDTAESVTEATQRYVLAANILGPRPQEVPAQGERQPQSFLQLRAARLQEIGNVLVELESQFPFNLAPAPSPSTPGSPEVSHDWITRAPYFCVPRNQRMLAYWDRVTDRLSKIRNCMSLEGVVRQLALFEPAIEPGLLVKAAAAGIDTGAVAAGFSGPAGSVRGHTFLQLARGLCDDVRALGNALLSALEKEDAEAMVLLRQEHELKIHQRAQDVRYLAWRQAQESTDALARSREMALERYRFHLRLLGLDSDHAASGPLVAPRPATPHEAPKLTTEKDFDEAYRQLVLQFDRPLPLQLYPQLKLAGGGPTASAGASSPGRLNLTANEDKELNEHLPASRDLNLSSSILDTVASVVRMIPDIDVDLHFWGLGLHSKVFGGDKLSEISKIAAGIVRTKAAWEHDQAGMAARTASYERRADEWRLQTNVAAHELMHLGRQMLGAIIAEQAAHREYHNTRAQIADLSEIDALLKEKYTNRELYGWMQGELSRVYFDSYRFALDVARKAELTLKRELMQPEFDAVQFIRSDYWNAGRKGLLAADSLAFDLRRLEVAHQENRHRECELVRHVSVNQLDPLALVRLRETGTCEITVPESLFDLDCPGHYMRRLKHVSVSIPAVTGPYTSVNCTLSLLRSSVRTVATGADYPRHEDNDERFQDYSGAIRAIVTSTARDDAGMFASSASEDRPLPFEGAGAISTWRIELPTKLRQFAYDTIADVVVHLGYTARDGGQVLRNKATGHLGELIGRAEADCTARLFATRLEFPGEWARFRADEGDRPRLTVTLREEHYPYWSLGHTRETTSVMLLARGPADADAINVYAGPEQTAPSDVLSRDDALGGLFTGRLANITLPPAVGETALHFDVGTVTDLWVILTWKGRAT